ncbi:MAG: hypothetical protein U1F54_22120 [Burkholderiales bacterium]
MRGPARLPAAARRSTASGGVRGRRGSAVAPPRIMGSAPRPPRASLLAKTGLSIGDMSVIELNEAFAAQASR